MLQWLLDTIKNYLYNLNDEGLYVSIHTDFAEYMLPFLEFNIHQNPKCLLVKSDDHEWNNCIRIHRSGQFSGTFQKRRCPKGVEEFVFPLQDGGTVCVSKGETCTLSEEKIKAIINPLCAMLQYLALLCPETENETSENEMVNRFIKYIQRNFYHPIKNEDIAGACSCSVSTLCHLFKNVTGTSVHAYVLKLRMSYAKRLLKTSSLSVTAIAGKAGFSDYNGFSIYFRKKTGMSPTQYRNRQKLGSDTVME